MVKGWLKHLDIVFVIKSAMFLKWTKKNLLWNICLMNISQVMLLTTLKILTHQLLTQISLYSQNCDAVKFMHVAGLLHNVIKASNVLLKQMHYINLILINVGKVRSRYYTDIYKPSEPQEIRNNMKYPHLAYKLRTEHVAKQQSVATDVRTLSWQMLEETPVKRIDLVQVWKSFQQKI